MNESDQSESRRCEATVRPEPSVAARELFYVELTHESLGTFFLVPRIAAPRLTLGRSNSQDQRRVTR